LAAGVLTAAIGLLAWDAPQSLGSSAGALSGVVLAISAGVLVGLVIGKPARRAVWAGVAAVVAVAAISIVSVARTMDALAV
jgi:uncharacterized membrane protein (Fun14 family)